MDGSEEINIGFIDSGTTFTYIPMKLWNMLIAHFDWFCRVDENNCAGERVTNNPNAICFKYDEKKFPKGPLTYFMTYPILRFKVRSSLNQASSNNTTDNSSETLPMYLEWYPSEYLYRDKTDLYCMGAERHSRTELIIGGTMMR
jgi:hypothetical protein